MYCTLCACVNVCTYCTSCACVDVLYLMCMCECIMHVCICVNIIYVHTYVRTHMCIIRHNGAYFTLRSSFGRNPSLSAKFPFFLFNWTPETFCRRDLNTPTLAKWRGASNLYMRIPSIFSTCSMVYYRVYVMYVCTWIMFTHTHVHWKMQCCTCGTWVLGKHHTQPTVWCTVGGGHQSTYGMVYSGWWAPVYLRHGVQWVVGTSLPTAWCTVGGGHQSTYGMVYSGWWAPIYLRHGVQWVVGTSLPTAWCTVTCSGLTSIHFTCTLNEEGEHQSFTISYCPVKLFHMEAFPSASDTGLCRDNNYDNALITQQFILFTVIALISILV